MRKFMVGLPVQNSLPEWDQFLKKYHDNIYSVYFSLPLGDRFHARRSVSDILRDPEAESLFWDLLRVTQGNGVPLELLLNTVYLTKSDVELCKRVLERNGIFIQSITILDEYYDDVRDTFGDIQLNYSFNNYLETESQIPQNHRYRNVIIGRKNIRNRGLALRLKERGLTPVLLVNNGCNFFCHWCGEGNHCRNMFQTISSKYDINYLYALFSVFPSELDNEHLGGCYDLYKISNRNADVSSLCQYIDSYLGNGSGEEALENPWNYITWCRLSWFGSHYRELDLKKIQRYKEEIYHNIGSSALGYEHNEIVLDLTDSYTVSRYDPESIIHAVMNQIYDFFDKDMMISAAILGSMQCSRIVRFMDMGLLRERIRYLRSNKMSILFATPNVSGSDYELWARLLDSLIESGDIDALIVNDLGILDEYKGKIRIILGRQFDKRVRDPRVEGGCAENTPLLDHEYLESLGGDFDGITLECLPDTKIAPSDLNIYTHLPMVQISSGKICEFASIGRTDEERFFGHDCKCKCVSTYGECRHGTLNKPIFKRYNSLFYEAGFDGRTIKMLNDSRVKLVFTPDFWGVFRLK